MEPTTSPSRCGHSFILEDDDIHIWDGHPDYDYGLSLATGASPRRGLRRTTIAVEWF